LIVFDLITKEERLVYTARHVVGDFKIRLNGDIVLCVYYVHVVVIRPREEGLYTEVCSVVQKDQAVGAHLSKDGTCLLLEQEKTLTRYSISDDGNSIIEIS